MLMDSGFTASIDNPIQLQENSGDVKTLMIIISGHPCKAELRCLNWETGKRLYLLMQKYQLDRLRPWFSILAAEHVETAPLEALCLACNNPCFDENLAREAISYGIEHQKSADLFDPAYFIQDYAEDTGSDDSRKLRLLNPCNTQMQLSLDLGFTGFVAYCQAFSNVKGPEVVWHWVARDFINAAREFGEKRKISVREPCYCSLLCTLTCLPGRSQCA
jgi:hypothetical protein